jgi:hypothetical protein
VHPRFVEISVKGDVDPASVADFDGVSVTADRGVTRLRLLVRDGPVLYGLLDHLQSTGLEVLAVSPLDEDADESPHPNTTPPPNEGISHDELT